MKPKTICLRRPSSLAPSFTLVELMVSMAILAVLTLLFLQIFTTSSNLWISGRAQAENFSQARVALDVISRDLEAGVFRQDLPAFYAADGSSAFTFYSKQQGLKGLGETSARPLSFIRYEVTNIDGGTSVLRRTSGGFDYGTDVGYSRATWTVQMAPQAFDADIGPGVLIMKYQFISTNGLNILPQDVNQAWTNKPGNPEVPGVQNLGAAIISLAVVDGRSMKILQASGKLAQLQANFQTNNPGNLLSYRSAWQAQLENPSSPLTAGAVPQEALRGLRTFERTVMLPHFR
ncbi:MAG: type II secretion system protein J [Candidatus Methylacidiphilales bacterium]